MKTLQDLVDTNRSRSREEFEYELLDTGVFEDDRYFDVFVEYAENEQEDVLIRITVHNRGVGFAEISVLVLLCLAAGWVLGGQAIGIRKAVGLTTAARNVGVALVIATASFPDSAAMTAVIFFCDLPNGWTRADCAMDGPILFSTSIGLRAGGKRLRY